MDAQVYHTRAEFYILRISVTTKVCDNMFLLFSSTGRMPVALFMGAADVERIACTPGGMFGT
jgi:hypothetical protein